MMKTMRNLPVKTKTQAAEEEKHDDLFKLKGVGRVVGEHVPGARHAGEHHLGVGAVLRTAERGEVHPLALAAQGVGQLGVGDAAEVGRLEDGESGAHGARTFAADRARVKRFSRPRPFASRPCRSR